MLDSFGNRDGSLLERVDRPVFAEHVMSGIRGFPGRWPAYHELAVVPLDEQRFVRVALVVAQYREVGWFTEASFEVASQRFLIDESLADTGRYLP